MCAGPAGPSAQEHGDGADSTADGSWQDAHTTRDGGETGSGAM